MSLSDQLNNTDTLFDDDGNAYSVLAVERVTAQVNGNQREATVLVIVDALDTPTRATHRELFEGQGVKIMSVLP